MSSSIANIISNADSIIRLFLNFSTLLFAFYHSYLVFQCNFNLIKKGRCNLLLVTSLEGCIQRFKGGRAQSGALTALIGYLNVLLEYFDFQIFIGRAQPYITTLIYSDFSKFIY